MKLSTSLLLAVLAFTLTLLGCSDEPFENTDNIEYNENGANSPSYKEGVTEVYALKPKVKFKHSCCRTQCNGCQCPLGICITAGIVMDDITAEEAETGDYGYVQVGISNDKLHMVFEDDVAIDDQYFSNEIPIEADFEIDEHLAALLGYESVTIEAGTYEVDFSNYGTYGEAYFDIDVVANDVPSVYTTKPKIKFKHSGGNTQCNGCKCPLGICITVGFVSSTGGISVEEYRDHVAQAQIGIEDDQVHLIFEVPVADENDEIVLSSDFYIDEVVAEALGYEAIEISSGTYTVDFSNYESYGEVFLDANLEE